MPSPDGSDDEDDNDDDDAPWAGEGYERVDGRTGAGVAYIGVLPANRVVVEVFRRCQPQIAIGMGIVWQGVCAREVFPACLMSHVRKSDWPRVLDGVQFMAMVVASVRNAESARQAKRNAS